MNSSLRLTSITCFSPNAAPIHRSAWKKNSAKFTVANGPSGASPSTRLQHEGTPLASKSADLVPFVAPICIKGLRLVTARLPEKSSPIGPGLNQLPLYGVLGSLGASGRAQTSSKSFGSSFLKKGSIEERL